MPVAGDDFMDLSIRGTDVYQPRNPQASNYFQCVEDHFEAFEQVYEDIIYLIQTVVPTADFFELDIVHLSTCIRYLI